jgi:hypothetical protein
MYNEQGYGERKPVSQPARKGVMEFTAFRLPFCQASILLKGIFLFCQLELLGG